MWKNFGKGCLYVAIFPLGIVAIAIYAVVGFFIFIYQLVRLLILFFTGRKLNSDLPEDIEAKRIIDRQKENKDLSLYPSDSIVYDNGFSTPILERHQPVEEERPQEAPKHFEEPVDEPLEEPIYEQPKEEKEEVEEDDYFDHLV